jgi:hypothetical protein
LTSCFGGVVEFVDRQLSVTPSTKGFFKSTNDFPSIYHFSSLVSGPFCTSSLRTSYANQKTHHGQTTIGQVAEGKATFAKFNTTSVRRKYAPLAEIMIFP